MARLGSSATTEAVGSRSSTTATLAPDPAPTSRIGPQSGRSRGTSSSSAARRAGSWGTANTS
jgi:hypothetical protein